MLQLAQEEPDAGLSNGGLRLLPARFIDSLSTLQIPAIGYDLRYHYGISRQDIQNGYQVETADLWLHRPDPWEVRQSAETVEVTINATARPMHGVETLIAHQPSVLLGISFDRPVIGCGGKIVNTLAIGQTLDTDEP